MKRNTLQKSFDSREEELDVIDDIDDILNLVDLLRIVIIHEECENLKVFVDGRELPRNINRKKKPGVSLINVNFVTNFIGESISSISMWNIVNQ